jgi:hypothetical protein
VIGDDEVEWLGGIISRHHQWSRLVLVRAGCPLIAALR